jgi:hypothetical protein
VVGCPQVMFRCPTTLEAWHGLEMTLDGPPTIIHLEGPELTDY